MSTKKTIITKLFILIPLLGTAQSKEFTQKVERIGDTLYLIEKEERFKVDTEVVTIKLKPSEKELGADYKVVRSNRLGYIDIKVPEGVDVERYVNDLKKTERFETVEFNGEAKCCFTPNDTLIVNQWHINRINLNDAWDITKGNPNIKVAIIDAGVDASHYDLGYGNDGYTQIDTSNGVNYTSVTNAHISPILFHGTFVAGVLGAKTNNTTGIAGVLGGNHSKGTTIIPYCVTNSYSFDSDAIDDAIIDAIDKGAKIINISLILTQSSSIDAAIEAAYDSDVTIVCSSGNNYLPYVSYPASHEKTIAVGAIDQNNQRASFSQYGYGLDLVAPGVDIYSTTLNNGYESRDGTSYSAPQVAGVAALMLSVNPMLTPDEIRSILQNTCIKLPDYNYNSLTNWNFSVGYGLLNAFSAVYFSAAHSIVGPSTIDNSSGSYYIDNLPNCMTVEWSLSDSYFNQYCFQQNSPAQNQCTITGSNVQDMTGATLTAIIKHNGTAIDTLTKNNITVYQGLKGTYVSSIGSGQYIASNPIYTAGNTVVQVSSHRMIGATFTFSGNTTPSSFTHNNDKIYVGMPSTGNTIVVQVNCSNGDIYYIPIIKASRSNNMSVSFDGDMMTITLDEAVLPDQVWTLEVYNVANGEKIVTREVSGNSASINTSGWKRGLYIVCATIGKEVLTEKMQIR